MKRIAKKAASFVMSLVVTQSKKITLSHYTKGSVNHLIYFRNARKSLKWNF